MSRFIFLLFLPLSLSSQDTLQTRQFELRQYLEWVRTYHPTMQQSRLLANEADARVLESRGGFDPKLFGDYEDKQFDDKDYFRIGEAGLKVPTWWGGEVKLAYTWATGVFLNPANNLPDNGQAVAEITVPLGRGLFFDERRAQLQQAQLYREANEATRRVMVNKLLHDALEAYWQWSYQYQKVDIYRSAYQLAEDRLVNVKAGFFQGDLAAVDTLESLIGVQNRSLQLQKAEVDYDAARLQLSNFLWYNELTPLEVSSQLRPAALPDDWNPTIDQRWNILSDSLPPNHPELQQLFVKGKQLQVKERLKREYFKPQVDLSYAFLGEGFNLSPSNDSDPFLRELLQANYKWGVRVEYPIFLRKARGGLQRVRIEQQDLAYKTEQKQLELLNKIRANAVQLSTVIEQQLVQEQMVNNYESLLDAENEKFRIGESSIFLINSREQKLITAQLKAIDLEWYRQQLWTKWLWAQGRLQ